MRQSSEGESTKRIHALSGTTLPCGQTKGAGYHETIETDDFTYGSKHKDV